MAGYELVMPFVGQYADEPAYAAGWEMGRLDALLEHTDDTIEATMIRAVNLDMADLVAMRHGWTKRTVTELDDGWLEVVWVSAAERMGTT